MNICRLATLAIAAASLALTGCGGGEGSDEGASDAKAQGAAQAAPAQKTAPNEAALPEPGSPAEETMAMFVDNMRQGEFELALLLIDPSSEGYVEIEKTAELMRTSADRTDESGITLGPIMKLMFSRPWKSVTYRVITEEPDRVRFDVTFPNESPSAIDVAKVDGEWLVIAPRGIAKYADISDQLPENMKPGAPKPPAP